MADISKIVDELSKLTVLEVSELVKELEDKWGVSAAAPVAAVAAGGGGDAGAPAAAEKTSFTVHMKSFGGNKIAVIKEVRGLVSGLSLADAKKMVESAPADVKADVPKEEAEEIKKKLEAAGAEVEIK